MPSVSFSNFPAPVKPAEQPPPFFLPFCPYKGRMSKSPSLPSSPVCYSGGTAFALAAQVGALPGRIQLFPCGTFAASDGRPGNMHSVTAKVWRVNAQDASALIAAWQQQATPLVVDYEHQTQLAAENGKPAPAAGWIQALAWEEGRGLFATVEWTERARAHIRAGEYRYISPVFSFDKHSGAVLRLVCAALTNHPALDGMDAARAATEEHKRMNTELLEALRIFFGLAATADEEAVQAALKAQPAGATLASLLAAKDTEIASLKKAEPDPAHFVPMALLTAEQEKTSQLRAKVSELESGKTADTLNAEIQAALADGRLPKSCEGWAKSLTKTAPDSLRTYLKSAVSAAALTAMQTKGKEPEAKKGCLTEDEKYACAQAGISEADFLAQKTKEKN